MAAHAEQPELLSQFQRKLAPRTGRAYWRGLEELAESAEFRRFVEEEFPHLREHAQAGLVDRRQFLTVLAASLAAVSMNGCTRQPPEEIVPRVRAPEYMIPGKPLYYASSFDFRGVAQPVLVESHEGRPTKIEGNPEHPASRGATSAITQASILSLYDPDRAKVVTHKGLIATRESLDRAMTAALEEQNGRGGSGLRILTEPTTSPTLHSQLRSILRKYPEARWHQYSAVSLDHVLAGTRAVFGQALEPHYEFQKADVILSLDADFLLDSASAVRHTQEFAARRRVRDDSTTMNRLYVVEPSPTITGAKADHRKSARQATIREMVWALGRKAGINGIGDVSGLSDELSRWMDVVWDDLTDHRGASLVMAGDQQPPAVHATVHAINHALGNINKTVFYTQPVYAEPVDTLRSIGTLTRDLNSEYVDLLLILGGNPAYTAPADLKFDLAIEKAGLSIYLGMFKDETAARCDWHIPRSHYLESWGDLRAGDGLISLVQPLIAPLYNSMSDLELLAMLQDGSAKTPLEMLKSHWRENWPGGDFEEHWGVAVHDGFISGTSLSREPVELDPGFSVDENFGRQTPSTQPSKGTPTIEVAIRPDPTIWDGTYANNPWLQELPKPLTKLTWDNAILISPTTARRLGVESEQLLEIWSGDRSVTGPAFILPGQTDDCLTLHLGYGRRDGGTVGRGAGFSAYDLRTVAAQWHMVADKVIVLPDRKPLSCTQLHHSMEGRDLIRTGPVAEFRKNGHFLEPEHHGDISLSLYPEHKYDDYAWGMSIDLGACVGCNACAVACQSENNIPSVGREEVRRGREMSWIRVDRYFFGAPESPGMAFQPVPCMHCENAPCEVVCPVGATVHGNEGLNEMVYNRCVGTRYCANNCPYKVRRFNYFTYADHDTQSLKLEQHTDVTVRRSGVMEK